MYSEEEFLLFIAVKIYCINQVLIDIYDDFYVVNIVNEQGVNVVDLDPQVCWIRSL